MHKPELRVATKHNGYVATEWPSDRPVARSRRWRASVVCTGRSMPTCPRRSGVLARTGTPERSRVPTKDQLRPVRGLPAIRTGQRAIEGVERAQAVQRRHAAAPITRAGERD